MDEITFHSKGQEITAKVGEQLRIVGSYLGKKFERRWGPTVLKIVDEGEYYLVYHGGSSEWANPIMAGKEEDIS